MSPHSGKYAWTVKVGEKGQFVIPKEAREIFNIQPGDTLIVLADINRGIAIPPKNLLTNVAKIVFSDAKAAEEEE
ncbi:MAG: AbrB/MazE/SpoVT family DNA-binding domain-containing protein [Bacillota bacterium]|nr:AbrB/MazE/SpoVT family DNA-binding domain-containing protein [Bacillota bacterium]